MSREIKEKDPRLVYEQGLLSGKVSQIIGGLLETHGITRRELARRLGVGESRVTRILNGTENLTLETVAALGLALGLRFAVVPLPLADRAETPAAGDPPPPRWLAGQRRLAARASLAEPPPKRPGQE